MPEYDASQVEAALLAARDISAATALPAQDDPSGLPPDPAERSELRANQRKLGNLLAAAFMRGGLELDKVDEILSENQAAKRCIAQKRRTETVMRSSSLRDGRLRELENRRKTLEHLAAAAESASSALGTVQWQLLPLPVSIDGTPDLVLQGTNIEKANSWAKFTVQGLPSSAQLARFNFVWSNPRDAYVVINVEAYMSLNGFCSAESDGGFFPDDDRKSYLGVSAMLSLREWWNDPPTEPFPQLNASRHVVAVSANSTGWLESGDFDARDVLRFATPRYNLFLIPPGGVAHFSAAVGLTITGGSGGRVLADFASGDFDVRCPYLMIGGVS